jgi:peptide/nickel transport system permease protein
MSEEITTAPITVAQVRKHRSIWAELFIRLVKEKPLGVVGGVIVVVLLLTGILADVLAPFPYAEVHPKDALLPPGGVYMLGTDGIGRDLLSRVIYGARISMVVGLSGAAIAGILATIIGGTSGFFSGRYDTLIQRFVDSFMCFPPLFFLLAVMAVLGQGMTQVILVLGVQNGIRQSRVVRSAVIGIKENVYFDAATAIGAPWLRILIRHVLPNIMAPIIIMLTLSMGQMILMESVLSFLGFGIPPPMPSWGSMLSGEGRNYMYFAPWIAIWPGLALSIAIYGINMFGDAVRDILDPRLRGGLGRYEGVMKKKKKVLDAVEENAQKIEKT